MKRLSKYSCQQTLTQFPFLFVNAVWNKHKHIYNYSNSSWSRKDERYEEKKRWRITSAGNLAENWTFKIRCPQLALSFYQCQEINTTEEQGHFHRTHYLLSWQQLLYKHFVATFSQTIQLTSSCRQKLVFNFFFFWFWTGAFDARLNSNLFGLFYTNVVYLYMTFHKFMFMVEAMN